MAENPSEVRSVRVPSKGNYLGLLYETRRILETTVTRDDLTRACKNLEPSDHPAPSDNGSWKCK